MLREEGFQARQMKDGVLEWGHRGFPVTAAVSPSAHG
jgi:hypothetical protein